MFSLLRVLSIVAIAILASAQKCFFDFNERINFCNIQCRQTNFETILYDIFDGNNSNSYDNLKRYDLSVTDSEFPRIYSFLPPLPKNVALIKLSLTKSLVEFIEDQAFIDFEHIKELDLSKNKLSNITFVSSLPRSLQKLVLSENKFKNIGEEFKNLPELHFLDLSNCKINSLDPNSFVYFYGDLYLNLSNNRLASFDVLFRDALRLALDLSFNNIKCINNQTKRTYLQNLNVSHNEIESVSDISCQDCGYPYYRRVVQFIDLSFNNMKDKSFINSFSGLKIAELILSNSNVDSNFDFEIIKYITNTLDLSNNKIGLLHSKMFDHIDNPINLFLFNSSITLIEEETFNSFTGNTLNISCNLITTLNNFTFKNSKLRSLDISKCMIDTIHLRAFWGLSISQTLNLSHNKISNVSEHIFQNLTCPCEIDLSFNPLKKLNSYLFFNCRKLEKVYLSNCELELINRNAFSGRYTLSELHLQNNYIKTIDFQLEKVHGLLNLQNNQFTKMGFLFLSNSSVKTALLSKNNIQKVLNDTNLHNTASIRNIDLSNSHIYSIDVLAFNKLNKLDSLNLSENLIEKVLPKTFSSQRELSTLDLRGNKIRTFSRDAFVFGNRLKELRVTLSDTNINANSFITLNQLRKLYIFDSFVNILEENSFNGLIRLEKLVLENTQIKEIVSGAFNGLNSLISCDFHSFFTCIHKLKSKIFVGLTSLQDLDLSNLKLIELESETFSGLKNLKALSLNNNRLKSLAGNTFLGLENLSFLNLSSNFISELHPQSFCGLFNLVELNLSDNNITDLVLGTFQEFPNLRILNLRKNNINKLLTGTFSNLKLLSELDLSHNNITKLKIENLMPLTSLTWLELTGNHLIQISHLDMIKQLRKLEFVGINDNKWKCDNLSSMLIAFQNYSVNWVSTKSRTFTHENIDGIKCYDICKFFYCVEEEESLYGAG